MRRCVPGGARLTGPAYTVNLHARSFAFASDPELSSVIESMRPLFVSLGW